MKRSLVLIALAGLLNAEAFALENIALGKTYASSRPPNYIYCTDAGDATQLTDGETLRPGAGGFWTNKRAVGWSLGGPGDRTVTVDLNDPSQTFFSAF